MSTQDSSWDDVDPSKSAQIRKGTRTTDETDVPAALRDEDSQPVVLGHGFDFDDVGPTEVTDEMADDEAFEDVPMYEPFSSGDTIGGRYRITRMLGRGATGVVYEASHTLVGKRVAVKCLFPHMAAQPVQVKRLFREARIAAAVEHPNVVQVFDGGRDGDTYYLAMELLEGRTLTDMIEEGGALPLKVMIEVFMQIMSGVAAVHDEGVVHRDLKPDNIYMQMRHDDPLALGVPKVLDFGVSKLKERPTGKKAHRLTAMGMVMGTPYYMAPEQVADTSGVDRRADVYSLGVMMYEALTGVLPFQGESVIEIFTQASEGKHRPMSELRPGLPPALEALVLKAMHPEKEGRFEDVHEMRRALHSVPLDGSGGGDDWNDKSEQWMFDKQAAVMRPGWEKPMEVAPTQAMYQPGAPQPTPITNPRPASVRPPTPTVQIERDGIAGRPIYVWLLLAAAAGGLVAAVGAVLLYLLLG